MAKIKETRALLAGPSVTVNAQAAARFVKAALAGNVAVPSAPADAMNAQAATGNMPMDTEPDHDVEQKDKKHKKKDKKSKH